MDGGVRHVANAMRAAAAAERGPASWLGRVVDHQRIGWDLAAITVRTSEADPVPAGQYVSVETPQRPRLWRYLSPANAPRPDGSLEFHVRAVTGRLGQPGDRRALPVSATRWRIGPPMGRMSVDPQSRDPAADGGGRHRHGPDQRCLEEFTQRPRGRRAPSSSSAGALGRPLRPSTRLRKLSYDHDWLDVVPVVERDDDAIAAAGRASAARWPTSSPGTGRGRATTCWSAARPP